jgi:hypothetical protein
MNGLAEVRRFARVIAVGSAGNGLAPRDSPQKSLGLGG